MGLTPPDVLLPGLPDRCAYTPPAGPDTGRGRVIALVGPVVGTALVGDDGVVYVQSWKLGGGSSGVVLDRVRLLVFGVLLRGAGWCLVLHVLFFFSLAFIRFLHCTLIAASPLPSIMQ
jgi:hypothetical protein